MKTRWYNSWSRPALLIVMVCALCACNTNPPRPKPVPQPRAIPEAPPPPQSSTQPEQPQAREAPSAKQQSYPEPSADAAEVEVEEIRLDGESEASEQTASAENIQAQRETGGDADRGQRTGGGGSSGPRGSTYEAAESDPGGSTGVVLLGSMGDEQSKDLIGPNMNVGAKTEGEQIAALDDKLSGSLAEFDERMRRARAAAEMEKMQAPGGGSPSGIEGGRGQRNEAPDDRRGAGGAAATGTGLGNTPDLVGETGGGRQHVAAAAPPPDIPDGRNDDIVARQLREAASKETDPVLREKLWEEYRKYKAGL